MRRAVGAVLLFALTLSGHTDSLRAQPQDDHKLLRLGGTHVKWGPSETGSGAVVRYAVATRSMVFPDARNCKGITSLADLTKYSRVSVPKIRAALRAGFDAWSNVADVRFVEVHGVSNADIIVGTQLRPRGRAFADVTYVGSHAGRETRRKFVRAFQPKRQRRKASLPFSRLTRGLICLNPRHRWKVGFDGDLSVYDLTYTFTHEIGHVLGLDHARFPGQIMHHKYHEDFIAPRKGDRTAVALLYGRPGRGAVGGSETETRHAVQPPQKEKAQTLRSAPVSVIADQVWFPALQHPLT